MAAGYASQAKLILCAVSHKAYYLILFIDHKTKQTAYSEFTFVNEISKIKTEPEGLSNLHTSLHQPLKRSRVNAQTKGQTLKPRRNGSTHESAFEGSRPTAAVLCPWARHFTPRKYWLITQEAVAPSRHDWKIVDWDVKPQHKQTRGYLQRTGVGFCPHSHHNVCLSRIQTYLSHITRIRVFVDFRPGMTQLQRLARVLKF